MRTDTLLRVLLGAAVIGGMLAAGCGSVSIGPAHFNKTRLKARQRWEASRAEMVTRLAEGCYSRGELGRARQHVEEVISSGATYAPAYILAARLSAEKGDLEKAREHAQTARIIDPTSPEACYVLGTLEQAVGHNEQALREFSEAARLGPNEPRYVLAEAEMLVIEGQAELAIRHLQAAIGRMPARAELHSALGDVLLLERRYQEAAGSYRIALRLGGEQTMLRERLAMALARSGAYDEAESMLADLASAQKEGPPAWLAQLRAECLLARGRPDEARAILQPYLKAAPDVLAVRLTLAKCDILEDRLPSAREHLEEVLSRQPQDAQANALMGYVLVASGRPGEALPYLRLAAKDPTCEGRSTVERLLAQAESSGEPQRPGVPAAPDRPQGG